jgi:sugar lactone lactonase YvrE
LRKLESGVGTFSDLIEPRGEIQNAVLLSHTIARSQQTEVPIRANRAPESAQGAAQFNDVTVDGDGLIYVTDGFGGGLYIVEHDRGALTVAP